MEADHASSLLIREILRSVIYICFYYFQKVSLFYVTSIPEGKPSILFSGFSFLKIGG